MEKVSTLPSKVQQIGLISILRWIRRKLLSRSEMALLVLLLLVGLALSLRTSTFFTTTNMFNIARQSSWFAIAAFGVSLSLIHI